MRIPLIVIIISFSALYSSTAWDSTYGYIYNDLAYSLSITDDGKYAIAGYSAEAPIGYGFYILKVNQTGVIEFERQFEAGWALTIKAIQNDNYIVGGYWHMPSEYSKYVIMKVNDSGDTLWTGEFDGPGGYGVRSIAISGENYFALCQTDPTEYDIYLMKIDEFGDSIWTRTYGGPIQSLGLSIVNATESGFIIVGGTTISGGNRDAYIVKIDSLGNMVWDTTYGYAGTDLAYFIDTTSDGNYIITGETSLYYSVLFDVYLLKINDDGDTLWTRKIGGEDQSDVGRCVRPTTDGGYIITGWTYSYGIGTPDSSNVYLVKTDSLGYVEWERTYGGPGEDRGYSVAQTDDGGYIIAGVYDQGPHTDVYLIKTDSLGNVDWIREASGKPQELSLKISPNPFNSSCRIDASFGATVEIFDIKGHRLATGETPYIWEPQEKIESGIYLVRARIGERMVSKKVVMIR